MRLTYMDLNRTVVFKYSYIRPVHVALAIRRCRQTCRTGEFLDCCCEYSHVTDMTKAFADAYHDPALADPQNFLDAVEGALKDKRRS